MADPKTQVVITAKDETAAGFASAGAALQRFGGQFSALANPIGAASVAMGAASAALVASVQSAIDTGDQLNKLSQKTGIAVESLSTLAYAGDLSGVSIDALASGIKKLSVNMAEASTSATGKAAEAFKALGVEVKGIDGALRASDDVLGDIADSFANMKDGAGKTALAVALFGKAGADLIPLLNNGRKGLAEFKEEAEKLGLVMSGKTAKAAEEFNDNMRKLALSASALGKSIATDLLAPMAEYTRLVVEVRKAGAGLFSSAVLGAQLAGADNKPLQELKDRAASLQGTISFLTQGGQTPNDPIFGTKLKNSQAELAVLQKIIAARMKAAEDFGPPVAPIEKKDAPAPGGKDGADKEGAFLASLRQQLLAAQGDVGQYSKVLETVTSGSAKDFSQATKNTALALARQIDVLKENTKAIEDRARVLDKVGRAEDAAAKTVADFGFKQQQSIAGIDARASALGKTPFEIKQAEAARAIEKEYEDAVKKVNEELGKIGDIEGISQRTYELSRQREAAHIATAAALDAEKQKQDALNASWEYGADTALRKYSEEISNVALSVESALTRAFRASEDALVSFVKTGKLDFKSLADSIITDLVRIQIQESIMKPITKGASGFLGEGIGKLFSGFGFGGGGSSGGFNINDSFAGGGFTGSGARSGGMDGQGGFLAMLHPQETVIDHAQGGSAGGAVTVILNISTGVAQTVRAEISNLLPSISASVQGAVMDARLRGGSTRAAYRG